MSNRHDTPRTREIRMKRAPLEPPCYRARRRVLVALAAFAVPAVREVRAADYLAPTPPQTEGPFYPKSIPADHDSDLTQVTGYPSPAQGTRLYLSGRVLARDGTPLVGTAVELWQCDAFGRYHHVGDNGRPRDDGFQGYGVAVTDGEGRYVFKSIRPVAYSGRMPHLHVKVRTANGAALTTQIYIKGDAIAGDPVIASSPGGTFDRLSIVLTPAAGHEPGALAGVFDIVL
jgi:protocatechuate 3,4-dioxygenase, beta subunit